MTVAEGTQRPGEAHRHPARTTLPLLAACVAVSAWAAGPLIIRGISTSTPTVVFWRLGLAIPTMWALALVTGGRCSVALVRRALVPGVLFGVSMAASFASFRLTSIVSATLIGSLQPVLVLLVAGRLFGERVQRADLGWAGVALAGVAAVVAGGAGGGGNGLVGDLLAAASLVLFVAYMLQAKQLRLDGVHAGALIATVMTVAFVVLLPWSAFAGGDLGAVHGWDWVLLMAMVLGPGVLGHGLMTWSQASLDITTASLLTLANPVLSTVGAWVLFGEALQPVQVVGAAVVLVALACIVVGRQRRPPRVPASA